MNLCMDAISASCRQATSWTVRSTPIFAGGYFLTLRFEKGYFSSVSPAPLLVDSAALPAGYSAGQLARTTQFFLIPKVRASSALAWGCFFDMASRRRKLPKTT